MSAAMLACPDARNSGRQVIVLLSSSLLWALGPPVASAARTITMNVSRNRMAHLPNPGA